jgi:hypothetical protein
MVRRRNVLASQERNAMTQTLVSTYSQLTAANRARDELLASGFDMDCVHLSAQEDEAGAMKSNFSVGNPDHNLNEGFKEFGPDEDQQTYANSYADPQRVAEILLTVDTQDEQQTQQAADILKRCGAVRIDLH